MISDRHARGNFGSFPGDEQSLAQHCDDRLQAASWGRQPPQRRSPLAGTGRQRAFGSFGSPVRHSWSARQGDPRRASQKPTLDG
ncbi:MAG TPA: hypothetical protein VFU81_19740, partial [Thermomicrobiales bacterium]|nr:hypothetical protein [Thermomicrobiales bacterium]